MAISYIYDNSDEGLVKLIKSKVPKELKAVSAAIYITDKLEDIEKVPQNTDKVLIVITRNYTEEFVTAALDRTNHVMYKLYDNDLIVRKIIRLLEKEKGKNE